MNNVIKNLIERRSIRNFTNEQISKDDLNNIVEAGEYAPSGMGKQSPKMVVIQNKELIEKIAKINAQIMGRDTDPFYGAPTLIIVFADKTVGTYIEDGSLVMGNLLNAAHSLGLGGCWIHRAKETFETPEGKKLLKKWGIEENYVGIGNCIIGHIDGEYPVAKPRKEDYIKFIE